MYDGHGWRLSPAFDPNPVPAHTKPRILSTAIDMQQTAASLRLAMEVAPYFNLEPEQSIKVVARIAGVTQAWRAHAKSAGLGASAIERMASAFEHQDLEEALALEP